jgi:hypothetical protein
MLTDYQRYRLYEILPGVSILGCLILALVLSVVYPVAMIYFIILFDVYWLLKVFNYVLYLTIAWHRFARARRIDWMAKMRAEAPGYKSKRHVIFLTLYNEEWVVIRSAIESMVASVYDPSQFTVVVAGEARKEAHCQDIYSRIVAQFSHAFDDIVLTMHPANLPDEIPGKGSNLHYSEREMQKYIDTKGWNYDDIIVTMFDIDTVCDVSYFSYLTYLYCTHPQPTRSSYQPIALYNNNMWESPAVLRIMAFGTTFWTMMSLARQDGLVTFSSHSMSFRALVDAGFHEKRIVSEDSRIFYQCLLAYNGEYEVTPMYSPVSMDTVRDDSWWKSIKNLYLQQRRWAWGVEHVPFLLWEFRKKGSSFPLWKKIKYVFLEWEGKWSWCLVAILITVLGRLPLWLSGEEVRQSALWFNAPHVLGYLMALSMAGMFLSAILSLPLLPPRPSSHPIHSYVFMILQWMLLPISVMFVSAIPGIDAVIHLMRGKYLGFNISQKKRVLTS